MKRFYIILICLIISNLPCESHALLEEAAKNEAPKIFIYHIPDENETVQNEIEQEKIPDIVSDDVTADTSGIVEENNDEEDDFDEIKRITIDENGYEIDDMYSDVLKGYAVYDENEENAISLDNKNYDVFKIKLHQPYNYKGGKYLAADSLKPLIYSKYSNLEYSIKPISNIHAKQLGGFTAGTMFNQNIDYAEVEQSTGVYSRYDTKHFGIYTAYSKTLNSTNSNYNDNFYLAPELKINQYMTLREILSADITRNRKKAEFVVSINPFGKKDIDRWRIEFGTNATFDEDNELLKNQFKFSTNFKL
jgi:hypothetical protein